LLRLKQIGFESLFPLLRALKAAQESTPRTTERAT